MNLKRNLKEKKGNPFPSPSLFLSPLAQHLFSARKHP
jgi:hypothetical protein